MRIVYSKNEITGQAMYLRAQIYYARGLNYNALLKTDNQYEIKRAKELCETAVSSFPKSEGAINCQNLLNQIKIPTLNVQTEKINIPDQPFRSLVKYKNVNNLYLRIIKNKPGRNKKNRPVKL